MIASFLSPPYAFSPSLSSIWKTKKKPLLLLSPPKGGGPYFKTFSALFRWWSFSFSASREKKRLLTIFSVHLSFFVNSARVECVGVWSKDFNLWATSTGVETDGFSFWWPSVQPSTLSLFFSLSLILLTVSHCSFSRWPHWSPYGRLAGHASGIRIRHVGIQQAAPVVR